MPKNIIGQIALLGAICTPVIAVALEPSISLSIEHPAKPIIHGTTNLPDGAELMLTVTKIGGGYTGQDTMHVTAGQFTTDEFSLDGHQLPAGQYKIEVSMSMASLQPPSVQAVIGTHGERLTGRLLDRSMGEPTLDYMEQRQLGL